MHRRADSIDEVISPGRRRLLMQAGAAALFFCLSPRLLVATADAGAKPMFPETVAVVQEAFANEYLSRANYLAFARQAVKDRHANIAHLFSSLAASEAVHVRNYRAILENLGVTPVLPDTSSIVVKGTRENLHYTAEDELAEVDRQYPALLARLRREGHKEAIEKVGWSWRAERQHRALIEQILSGTGIFFGVLSERFRDNPLRYFVCTNCGSTLIALPKDQCPVCSEPVKVYREISRPA